MTANFWIENTDHDAGPLLSPAEIAALNRESFAATRCMVDLSGFPAELGRDRLLEMLRSISRVSDSPRCYADGRAVGDDDYARYEAGLNLDAIAAANTVRFGLVVKRADMRSYPTGDAVYDAGGPITLDRFQENALFPADAVAVLHASADGEWLLVQSYNYLAWVRASAVATGDRQAILEYGKRPDFIVVTGDKVFTDVDPQRPAVSGLQLDMGIRLPLATRDSTGNSLRGQDTAESHAVELPVRDEAGELRFEPATISHDQDVTRGYLPYTRQNLLRQSFKFLGERYGWGHSYNARDCSGFVSDVYKTFGIFLPRNSGDQSSSAIGSNLRFDRATLAESRLESLQSLEVGDLIYMPGHVMMYLGEVNGEPYVIHDVHGLSYDTADGEYSSGVLSGVSVTPLLPLRAGNDRSYVDSIASIKKIT